jgi:S-adenosylmethionine:diacylglycerol 3-amino-3-carboxypropyl transferase
MTKLQTTPTGQEKGFLGANEPHPSARDALAWVKSLDPDNLAIYLESFSSVAMTGNNRLAEICSETLRRLLTGQPVSDRYLLGLAWALRNMEEKENNNA